MYKKLNLPLTSSFYLVFSPREIQRKLKHTRKYTKRFFTLSEKERPTNL